MSITFVIGDPYAENPRRLRQNIKRRFSDARPLRPRDPIHREHDAAKDPRIAELLWGLEQLGPLGWDAQTNYGPMVFEVVSMELQMMWWFPMCDVERLGVGHMVEAIRGQL